MDDSKTGLTVSPAEAGQKLLNFLRRRVDAPDGDLHRWIRTGQVRINGGRAKAFDRVEMGDTVRIPPFAAVLRAGKNSAPSPGKALPGGPMPVVYEDGEILVIAKPAGLASQGGTGHDDSAAARIAHAFAKADFVPAPAHRLDRDTTGMLVFGKTYHALRFLADAFAGRGEATPQKYYLAWADGAWEGHPLELCDLLLRDNSSRLMAVLPRHCPPKETAKAVEARLRAFHLLSRSVDGQMRSLLLLRLITGRTHQIRAQLSARGHPVSGDPWYGSGGGLMLHAFRIKLPKPDGASLDLYLPPPWKGPWNVPEAVLATAKDMQLDQPTP